MTKINFIVFEKEKFLLPKVISSQVIIDILPKIKCGWCHTCKEKFFIHKKFEDHTLHNLSYVDVNDDITKICWITQKYPKLISNGRWKKFLQKNNLIPILYHL